VIITDTLIIRIYGYVGKYIRKSGTSVIRMLFMEKRQENLLTLVIEHYIGSAEPVGSRFLVEKAGLDWSEATVRNELRLLEDEGFLTHPHTSAGRIPTTKGYEYYVAQLNFDEFEASRQEDLALEKAFSGAKDYEAAWKNVAKTLVELSNETVMIAFSPEKIYYTGLSNLFQKPDFVEFQMVALVSQVFDHSEEYLPDFFEAVSKELCYFLGDEHPFGETLSVLSTRFGKGNQSLIALFGPQRMDYKKNWRLLKKIKEMI